MKKGAQSRLILSLIKDSKTELDAAIVNTIAVSLLFLEAVVIVVVVISH